MEVLKIEILFLDYNGNYVESWQPLEQVLYASIIFCNPRRFKNVKW